MPATERTFTVRTDLDTVREYLKDFAHTEQWDPGTQRCTRTDSGPVAVGSQWHNVSEFAGRETELEYTLRTLEPDHLVFVGENKTATSTDDIRLSRAAGGGTTINYHARIVFHGAARLVSPLFGPVLARLGDKTERQMTDVINHLTVAA